jgi:hypothetical protein
MNQLGQFEQNLLTELREVVAEQTTAPQPRRALPGKRLALATAGGGLLAAGLLVGLPALNGDQTPAAYAVETNADGSVTLTITRTDDAEGLERQLREHGIAAEVDYPPADKMCRFNPPRYVGGEGTTPRHVMVSDGAPGIDDFNRFNLRPADLHGKTLVIESLPTSKIAVADPHPEDLFTITIGIAEGPVAPCVLVDRP